MTTTTADHPHTRFDSDAARWAAFRRHDTHAEGSFVLAVKTTGIYCRPTCRSRTPNRENVVFFDSPEDARRAGFRACKRCRPDEPQVAAPHQHRIALACRWIEQADREPSLAALAASAGMSPFHFHKVFKSHVGLTPKQYARRQRVERLRKALPTARSVTDAIYSSGYQAPSRAYADAKASLGMAPAAYRDGGRNTVIGFAVSNTPLGWLLVAGTRRGVIQIAFGTDPLQLSNALHAKFSNARLRHDDPLACSWMDQIQTYLKNPKNDLKLPVELIGTDFQRKVWAALARIPAGKTTTYGELAAAIGEPHAARAVGHACGSNPVALAIPCHRAVGKDGKLRGYFWGTKRKRWLLAMERASAST